ADPFLDVPLNHWSYDAVSILANKGYIEGYPDGFFNGDRPLSRYEMAMITARIIAKMHQIESSLPFIPDLSFYRTEEEMKMILLLSKEYEKELASLGVKVKNLERSITDLNNKIEERERIFISGDLTSVANSLGFTEEPVQDPLTAVFPPLVVEEYAGFGLTHGNDISTKLNLDIGVNIEDRITAGGTLTAYSYFGNPTVTYFWGLMPGFISSGITYDKMFNNGLNFQTNLNKLWFKTEGNVEIKGLFGEYQPEKISPLVYYGIVGPSAFSPDSMPVNGIDINGKLYGKYKFELLEANDLTWSGGGPGHVFTGESPYNLFESDYYQTPQGYHSRMYGALGGYENEKWSIDSTFIRIYEDRASRPESSLIPKDEIIFHMRGNYNVIDDRLSISGEFARSWFDYNLLDGSDPSRAGNAIVFGGEGNYSSFDYEVKFVSIDGNYEPFNFRKIFTNTDEGAYIMSFYTANRRGFYSRLGYNLNEEKGRIDGGVAYLKQIDATMDTDPQTTIGSPYGFQDHYFYNNSTDKGREFYFDIGGNYKLTDDFSVKGRILTINFDRKYPDYIHNQTRNFLFLEGSYNITEQLNIAGTYKLATVNGIDDDGLGSDITLHIPGIELNYKLNENTGIGIACRFYNHNDMIDSVNDYNVNRVTTWMTMVF
ncbi:MAG: S-layer homology domain-containing protein, partial [Candidatus Eremiobacterota bacterium]